MDRDELKRQVETLRFHKEIKRMSMSDAIKDSKQSKPDFRPHRWLVSYIEDKTPDDGLVVTPDKKKNPWNESRKCTIL